MRLNRAAVGLLVALLCLPPGAIANPVDIREWAVPWSESRPRDPYVEPSGKVWFVGQRGHYVASLDPDSGEFKRYDLDPGTGPHNLIVAGDGADATVWYAGNLATHIGRLDPTSGKIEKFRMPVERARDPHTLVFDATGDIWFTVQGGNYVGRLDTMSGEVSLIDVPTRHARPYGIVLNSRDEPWVVEFGSNKLARIDRKGLALEEIELPNSDSRPRRLAITSDDKIWYGDYALGRLGRYDPVTDSFKEWDLPSGKDSKPYGIAVDKNDRIWVVETGVQPNRFVGFDTASEHFLGGTDVPSGGGTIRHMHYHEPGGAIWFGADTNYVGRAKVH
ncbi:MAG: lyase [Gammaproteobacteria bacterium]|nr:lyase [Gammaproteobacteria bacterium]